MCFGRRFVPSPDLLMAYLGVLCVVYTCRHTFTFTNSFIMNVSAMPSVITLGPCASQTEAQNAVSQKSISSQGNNGKALHHSYSRKGLHRPIYLHDAVNANANASLA